MNTFYSILICLCNCDVTKLVIQTNPRLKYSFLLSRVTRFSHIAQKRSIYLVIWSICIQIIDDVCIITYQISCVFIKPTNVWFSYYLYRSSIMMSWICIFMHMFLLNKLEFNDLNINSSFNAKQSPTDV